MPKIAHFADIHFRGLSRHAEYRKSFEKAFDILREIKPDIIYVGGDIVHSKTQGISPELIDNLVWWFRSLGDIAQTEVILGNHDGVLLNQDRQDAITPIVTALNHPRVSLYKKSGVYQIPGCPGYNWCVFSCFDEEGWKNVAPVEGDVNIALFHGPVRNSTTDINWIIEGETTVEFFEKYDFALLGDIHKRQFLTNDQRVAYCGSTIQQDYGEDPTKGFLLWDIKDRDTFDVKFFEVPNAHKFITIQWKGSVKETLQEAAKHDNESRFRIQASEKIPHAEFKQLVNELQIHKKASEVVLKDDHTISPGEISANGITLLKNDLRDIETHKRLFREYYKNVEMSSDDWSDLDQLIAKYVSLCVKQDDIARGTKWSLRSLEFDNTFVYGENNKINFKNLSGITGIFGRNRRGKSSVIGTAMYTLFNGTDRGAIKNVHVINTRKDYCLAKADVKINTDFYRIERQSVKKTDKSGDEESTTHLNLIKIDEDGNVLQDLTAEQRRDTEKELKRLLGTADDFLLTSLAAQGEMNTFIKDRSTARKNTLTRFLGLDVFEQMVNLAKEDSAAIKSLVKSAPMRDWDLLIEEINAEKKRLQNEQSELDIKLSSLRNELQEKQIALSTFDKSNIITHSDVERQKQVVDDLRNQMLSTEDKIKKFDADKQALELKSKELKQFVALCDLDGLKKKNAELSALTTTLLKLQHEHQREEDKLNAQKKSIELLSEVPCGDQFPSCKFIKNSHENKKVINNTIEKLSDMSVEIQKIVEAIDSIKKENLQEQIKKVEKAQHEISEISLKCVKLESEITTLSMHRKNLMHSLEDNVAKLAKYEAEVVSQNVDDEIETYKNDIHELNVKIKKLDNEKMQSANRLGRISGEIDNLNREKKKYHTLKRQWKTYEYFMRAISKRGIPLQIVMSQLPLINNEIVKILNGVVSFTVELEADPDSNAMDVYINYGDSRRIIEVASGMEKMISSLAIRVALINVSSLPKPDMLIIDEGFGSLDATNVEACNRLLVSLKHWFKTILIITHVDGVKDVVDNVIDITWNGKDAQIVYE